MTLSSYDLTCRSELPSTSPEAPDMRGHTWEKGKVEFDEQTIKCSLTVQAPLAEER